MTSISMKTYPSMKVYSCYQENPPTQCIRNEDPLPYAHAFDSLSTNNNTIRDTITSTSHNINSSNESLDLLVTDNQLVLNEPNNFEPAEPHANDNLVDQDTTITEVIVNNEHEPSPTLISPLAKINYDILAPQDKWFRDKHILLVNILGEPHAGVTTRSGVRDSEAASAYECLYVNFLSEIELKRVIEALEEEGWVIAMQEELNQFERNKVWTLVLAPYGKTNIGTKWIFKNKMGENGVIDVKSAFLNGKHTEEVYVQQPPGFKSGEFPNYVLHMDEGFSSIRAKKGSIRALYETTL
ncbi:retrovirus-related pol polyprotein from transposon TNT 1-94 [Tanacetum coccineum]